MLAPVLPWVAPLRLQLAPARNDPGDATAQRLTEGGDDRIVLRGDGRNAYGCTARPDESLLAFGSSTASTVSAEAFAAASQLHDELRREPGRLPHRLQGQRQRLLALVGAPPGTDLVWGASGTDLHLIATQLAAPGPAGTARLQAVMAEAAETGSGVPAALAASHFGDRSCQGGPVQAGAALAAAAALPAPGRVALRHEDGQPRSAAEIDAEFTALAAQVVASGRHCLLLLTDLSKTGLLAPTPACARRLQLRFAGRLQVLVDACQFRLAPQTVAAYLGQGFMVAVTGSKFVGGPAFCGALLLPHRVARAARRQPLAALRPYSVRSDWPHDWTTAAVLDDRPNLGLMLRWQAALTELQALRAVPDSAIAAFLQTWGAAVAARLAADAHFQPLAVPALHRGGPGIVGVDAGAWDRWQTIFPFILRHGGVPLSREQTAHLHRQLQLPAQQPGPDGRAGRFQLGQPVACGSVGGQPLSALRLCTSARWAAQCAGDAARTETAIAQAMQALDRLAELVATA
jgi:hypothetical protein